MREGVAPEDIAVLVREGGAAVEVLAAGLADYGVPVAPDARLPLARTRLGAGVLAFARAALPGGTAADVLTWLRTPGKLADPDAADALDARARRTEAATAADARRLWEGALPELDALAEAAAQGPAELLEALLAEAEAIWTAPHRRRAAVLGPEEAADARTAAELRSAARELRSLAEADPSLLAGGAEEVLEALAAVAVRQDAAPGRRARRRRAGDPRPPLPRGLRLRPAGRRVPAPPVARAVPRRRRPRLARARQRARPAPPRGRAGGGAPPLLRLRLAARRRSCSSPSAPPTRRATRCSRRRSSTTSARCSPTSCGASAGTRLLAEVTWPPATAPTPHELRRAQAAAERAPGARRRSARPAARRCWRRSPRAGRRPRAGWRPSPPAACAGSSSRCCKPARAEPDPEPMRRGSLAHAVLEATLRGLRERTGSARLGPDTLDAALGGARPRARRRPREPRPRARGRPRPGRPARARGGPRALPAPRGRERRRDGAAVARVELRPRGRQPRRAGAQRLGLLRHRPGRPDRRRRAAASRWCATTRARRSTPGRAGRRTAACRPRSTRSRRASCSGSSRPARSTSRSARATAARAGSSAPARRAATSTATWSTPRRSTPRCWRRARPRSAPRATMRAGRIRPCPSRCSPNGCAYPGICRAAEEAGVEGS